MEVEPAVSIRVAYWQVSDRAEHIDLGRKVYLLFSVSLLQDPLEWKGLRQHPHMPGLSQGNRTGPGVTLRGEKCPT